MKRIRISRRNYEKSVLYLKKKEFYTSKSASTSKIRGALKLANFDIEVESEEEKELEEEEALRK